MLPALGSASVRSPTKQGVRFVTGTVFCILRYHPRDIGNDLLRTLGSASCGITRDLLRAVGSASCDITHEAGGPICYVHWAMQFVISHTRQRVRLVSAVGSCIL